MATRLVGSLLLAVAILSPVATGQRSAAAVQPCFGLAPTIIGAGMIEGTVSDDIILGSSGNDTILGLGGDDVVCALGGNDDITMGDGGHLVDGSDGNDILDGGFSGTGIDTAAECEGPLGIP